MSLFTNVIDNIDIGIRGGNSGLNHGFERLRELVPNIQRGNLYLIGGQTGSGKSSFTYETFVFKAYDSFKLLSKIDSSYKLKILVWSLEMDKHIVITKAICRKIWEDYKKMVDVNFVLSRGKNRISQEVYNIVMNYKEYFEEFEDRVLLLETNNPTGIHNIIRDYMQKNGKEIKVPFDYHLPDGTIEKREKFDRYIPNSENFYVITIIDHIALIKSEKGFDKKQKIDKMMEYLMILRDKYSISPVIVQQLNRQVASDARFKMDRVSPTIDDFKESADTTDGANFVMALFSPNRYEIPNYRGFRIVDEKAVGGVLKYGLRDRFRSLIVLKNRDGAADYQIGLGYLGEVGHFFELPKAEEMGEDLYEKIIRVQKIRNDT